MNIGPSKRLTDILSNYLEFDQNQISLGLWNGDLQIQGVELKKDAFFPLLNTWKINHSTNPDLASFFTKDALVHDEPCFASAINLKLVKGSIGHFRARVPWKKLLLGSSDTTVHLELHNVIIRIGLESCIAKALENGGLEKLYSNDINVPSDIPEGNPTEDRRWKQEMIRIAEKCIAEKKDIPTPEEFSKLKTDFLSKIPKTEQIVEKSLLESFVKNFATSLGWRIGQGLKVDIQNVQIILEQDGVESGITCESIEIDEAETSTESAEDGAFNVRVSNSDAIHKRLVVSDCGVFVRPTLNFDQYSHPIIDDYVIQPTSVYVNITLRKGSTAITLDQLEQDYKTLEKEESKPKVRRGKRDKITTARDDNALDVTSAVPSDSVSEVGSQSALDMEQILSLSQKIDQELDKDHMRDMSAGISIKISIDRINVLISTRLLRLGNIFIDNTIRLKRGRPEQYISTEKRWDTDKKQEFNKKHLSRQWWRYSYFVTLRCIRRKQRLINEFSYYDCSVNSVRNSKIRKMYIDLFCDLYLFRGNTSDESASFVYNRKLHQLYNFEDQIQLEQIIQYRHAARIKSGAFKAPNFNHLAPSTHSMGRKKSTFSESLSNVSQFEADNRHRTTKSLVPPSLTRSNSGRIPLHQRNHSLSVQSISAAVDSIPSPRHQRYTSDLSFIMEDNLTDEGSVAFKGDFVDAMRRYETVVTTHSRKSSLVSSSDIPLSVTSSISFSFSTVALCLCSEIPSMNGEHDNDDLSVLTSNTFGSNQCNDEKLETSRSNPLLIFGCPHKFLLGVATHRMNYSSYTEIGGSMKYKRFSINTFGAQLCDKNIASVGSHKNLFTTTRSSSNASELFTSMISEHLAVYDEPFMTGKMIVPQNEDVSNNATLQIQVAEVKLGVDIDSFLPLLQAIQDADMKTIVPTSLSLNMFDRIRLDALLYRLYQRRPIFQPKINTHFECDGFEISFTSSKENCFQTMPAQLIFVSKSISFTQQERNSIEYDGESYSAFSDAFQEFPAHKFHNNVLSLDDFDITLNGTSILEDPIRIDILRSILSDTSDLERARSNFVFLISPIHIKLCLNSIQFLQSLFLECRHFLMRDERKNSHSIAHNYEVPRLSEFVKRRLTRFQIILQGFKVKIHDESYSSDINSFEARYVAIRAILSDLLSLAVCFPPPHDNPSVDVAKNIGINRLVALGLPKRIALSLLDNALMNLNAELRKANYGSRVQHGLFSPPRRHTDHKVESGDINPLIYLIKCAIDASMSKIFGEQSENILSGELLWGNAVLIELPSGFRLDWERYSFDSKLSGIVGDVLICDGYGSHFLTIKHHVPINATANEEGYSVDESTYSAFREAGIYFSISKHDCQYEFINGGSSSSLLIDDLAIKDNIRNREEIVEISCSLGDVDVLFADKQFSNFLDALNALSLELGTDGSFHNSYDTSDVSLPLTISADITNASILFTTDELQPFCNFQLTDLSIDLAKTSALALQNRKFIVTAKSCGFHLDDLSPEGQIYCRVLYPLNQTDRMKPSYPFQMTFAMSTDPTLNQNEVIFIFDEIRCFLLRRFVNELLQYFLYPNYGIGHFLAVRSASLQLSSTSPMRVKAPLSYQLHLLGCSVVCPVSSESEDLVAFESSKIVVSNSYLRESWCKPIVGTSSASEKNYEDPAVFSHDHDEKNSDAYDFHCLHSNGGSVVYDDSASFEYISGSFDTSADISRITVSIEDLNIFVGISDVRAKEESDEELYYLMKYLQLSDIVNGGLIFSGPNDLQQDLFEKTRRYDEIRSRRWQEVTHHPVHLEVYADFVNKTKMRLLVKDRITYAVTEAEDMHPFEIKLKMSQFNTLLSVWYGNMQELSMLFPLTKESIFDSVYVPECPSSWPEYGTDAFVNRMASDSGKYTEIAVSFEKLKLTCLYDKQDYFTNPPNCTYMIDADSDSIVISADFFTIHVDFDADKLMRLGCASQSFVVEDLRPKQTIFKNVLVMRSNANSPAKSIDMAWGLTNSLWSTQGDLYSAFQVTVFMTPDKWCLANVGMNNIDSCTKDLAFFWLLLEYLGAYFLNPQYGNPYFLAAMKRMESPYRKSTRNELIDPDEGCRNLDIRLWLSKPRISIPQDLLNELSDMIILKSNSGGIIYRYQTLGYGFSSQDIVTRDMSMLFLTGARTRSTSVTDENRDHFAKSLIHGLNMEISYEKFISTNHINVSVNIHDNSVKSQGQSNFSGSSSLQLSPLLIPSPIVCKPNLPAIRQVFSTPCDITMIPEYIKIASELMYAFAGPYPQVTVEDDSSQSPTFSLTANLTCVQIYVCEPILGNHFPIGVICISDCVASVSNISEFSADDNSLQAAIKIQLWIDYYKSGPTRSWEPFLEPCRFLVMYEKSRLRGQGVTITSDGPVHANVSGAFLETLDFARRSLQHSINKALGKTMQDDTAVPEENIFQNERGLKSVEDLGLDVVHEKVTTLQSSDRVAFSLINLTGQTMRYHQFRFGQGKGKTVIAYLENYKACALQFPATRTVIRNLKIVEVTSDVFDHIDDLPDFSHYIDIQIPGMKWIERISADVTGKRLLSLEPRSYILKQKLKNDWRLANAFSALIDISYFEGGRQATISSPFEVINKTRHDIKMIVHPDPNYLLRHKTNEGEVKMTFSGEDDKSHQQHEEMYINTLSPGDIFNIPILLMESALELGDSNLGSFWLGPNDCHLFNENNGSNDVGYSSKAVHLSRIVEESDEMFSYSSQCLNENLSTGHLLSCPVIESSQEQMNWPFCYCVEVKRSPLVAPFPGHGYDNTKTSNSDDVKRSHAVCVDDPARSRDEQNSLESTEIMNRNLQHGPVAYSIVIHPPIVIENLLPEPARFELMLASRRHVVWWCDLQPGESIPVHNVGLDSSLLLIINVGYCRTPNGGGALVHRGTMKHVENTLTGWGDVPRAAVRGVDKVFSAITNITAPQRATKSSQYATNYVTNFESDDSAKLHRMNQDEIEEDESPEFSYDLEDVATQTTVVDSLGQRLLLNIDNKLGGGGQRNISVSCPYWIVNTTEYALRYKQERSNSFVSGTIHSTGKDGSKPVDCSKRNVKSNRIFIDTIFPGRPGALSHLDTTNERNLLQEYTALLSKEIPLERLADMAFMFNYNEQVHIAGQSNCRLCMQLTVPYSNVDLNSEWSRGFSLETIGVPQIIGMHCLDGKQLEVSVIVTGAPGKLAAYTKIVRILPRYVAVNHLGRPFRLWQDSSLVHPSRVINDSKIDSQSTQEMPNWRRRVKEKESDLALSPYNFLFGSVPVLDYHIETQMKPGTVAHRQALYIATIEKNQMVPFHLPDTRADRELRIDLGPNWNLSASFPADVISEHSLEISRVIDLRLLRHVDNRARPKYKVTFPPQDITDFDFDSWDGELGIWFETIQWNDGRKIVVKGTKRGKYSYDNTDIHIGDELFAIDGKHVSKMDFGEVMSMLKARLAETAELRKKKKKKKFSQKLSISAKSNKMRINGKTPLFLQRLKRQSAKDSDASEQTVVDDNDDETEMGTLTLHFLTLEHRMRKVRETALQKSDTKFEDDIEIVNHTVSPKRDKSENDKISRKNIIDIDVSMKLLNQSIFIFIKERSTYSPYRIENRSIEFCIYFRQRNCENHPWKVLNPGETALYTWEEPMKANKLFIRLGNPHKLANREKKGFRFMSSRIIDSEDQGGFGPASTVKLDEVGFRGVIQCPYRDKGVEGQTVSENKFLFCNVDTDGATRVLIVSGIESLNAEEELKLMHFQSDILRSQIEEELARFKSLQNMKFEHNADIDGFNQSSNGLSTVNEDDETEADGTPNKFEALEAKLLKSTDHAGEGVITRTNQLLVEVLEATGLQGNNQSDLSSVCNPYCSVRLENRGIRQNVFTKESNVQKTYFIESTVSPKWSGMTFIFEVPTIAVTDPQKFGILVKVKDFHFIGKNKSIGMTEIHLRNLRSQEEVLGWYPLMSRTGRSDDVLNTAASSRVRGSIKLRIQWIYSAPALLDYFILLSQTRLNDLTQNHEGIYRRIEKLQSVQMAELQASTVMSFSSKIPLLSVKKRQQHQHRISDSQWPFSLRQNMRNSKLRQLFGRQHKVDPYGIEGREHRAMDDLVGSEPIHFERSQNEEAKTQLTPLNSLGEDYNDGIDDVESIDSANFQRSRLPARSDGDFLKKSKFHVSSKNNSNAMACDNESIVHLLMTENILYHKPDDFFHPAHMIPGIFFSYGFKRLQADYHILLKSWVVAYEYLNDPDFILKYIPGEKFSRKGRQTLATPTPIFPCLLLPTTAPSTVKNRNMEFQKQLKNARDNFDKAAQRSLLAVMNPGGWLKLRPISALHLPQEYAGMFIKIRYGSETCVTPTVDAKVSPVWSDESKWIQSGFSKEGHDTDSQERPGFFARQETDLEVRVEPMLTSGSLQLSVFGSKVNAKVELGVLEIPLANAISCCTEMSQGYESTVRGVYIRWFPLKSPKVHENGEFNTAHTDIDTEKTSDDLFSQYYTPCIKLAMWWVPDDDLFYRPARTSIDSSDQNIDTNNISDTDKYFNASIHSISTSLIDSYQCKELLSVTFTDIDARYSTTKHITQLSFALGHFQIDQQGDDSMDSVAVSPTLGKNPKPTVQLLSIRDNIRSKSNIDSFKHIAFAVDEMNIRIEEDLIIDVLEFYRRVRRRQNLRKQSLLRGAAGRMVMKTDPIEVRDEGFSLWEDNKTYNEVFEAVKAALNTHGESKRVYIEKLLLGAVKLNISYIKSSRNIRATMFSDHFRQIVTGSKTTGKPINDEDSNNDTKIGDMDAFRRWSELGFDDELARSNVEDIFSSISFLFTTIFSSVTDSPIRINAKQINNVFEPLHVIGTQLKHYYLKEMIYQLYKVILSLEAFGNPTMVVNSFMKGASDFVILPFKEFIRSPHNPSRLGLGLARGTLSLVSHISSGIFGFISKTTAFGGTLAASLSFDDRYVRWHAQQAADHARHKHSQLRPKGCDLAISAFAKPVQDIFAGLAFATSGLVVEPIRGAQQQGVVGFTRGFGIGTVGLVSKPIVGVFDALAHLTEAIQDLSLSANVFDKKVSILQKLRLPYVFSIHKILLPYNATDAQSANLLRLFPLKERESLPTHTDREVLVISEEMQPEPGMRWYIVVTTKRIVLFEIMDDLSEAPRRRWQILLGKDSKIISNVDNYLHNGIILRIVRIGLNQPPSSRNRGEQQQVITDDASAISDNRTMMLNPVTQTFSAFGTSKGRKKEKSTFTLYGEFQHRARLTRIHNAICCLTNNLKNVVYSSGVGVTGNNQGFTTFGPLHFEPEEQHQTQRANLSHLDNLPWIHDFDMVRLYDRKKWVFSDEYESSRAVGGADWIIKARAKATFSAMRPELPSGVRDDSPEVEFIMRRVDVGEISHDEAVEELAKLAESCVITSSPSDRLESGAFIEKSDTKDIFVNEDQLSSVQPMGNESDLAERLSSVERLLQKIIVDSSNVDHNKALVESISAHQNQRETMCNISTISALTGIDELDGNSQKDASKGVTLESLETERLRLEVQELRRQLAEKDAEIQWREEDSQLSKTVLERRKRKRIFKKPWKQSK